MVSILPGARSSWDVIGQQLGESINQNFPGSVQRGLERGQLQRSLGEISELAKNGGSPLDVTLSAMKAGAGIPGSERYLGQIIPMLQQMAAANAAQNAPLPYESNVSPKIPEKIPQQAQSQEMQNRELPGLISKQQNPFFPNIIGPTGEPGHIPKLGTNLQKEAIPTEDEQIREAKRIAKERTAQGIPTNPKEALSEVRENVQNKIRRNAEVDKELKQQIESQKTYGQRGVDYLKKYMKEPTPEMETIFQKEGETLAKRGNSEADINDALAKKAKYFGDTISKVENSISAPRLLSKLGKAFSNNYNSFEQAAKDVRFHVKPLIDLGLYDTARSLLERLDYGKEERDMIINPLNDQVLSNFNQIPKHETTKLGATTKSGGVKYFPIQESEIDDIAQSLLNAKKMDGNFSLLLARKIFEDKNYDWETFKKALDRADKLGFEYSPDQSNQRFNLDKAPLNIVEQLLEGLNLIGR